MLFTAQWVGKLRKRAASAQLAASVSLCIQIDTLAKGMVPPIFKAFSHQLVLSGNTLMGALKDVLHQCFRRFFF